jgi:hypothetical protein
VGIILTVVGGVFTAIALVMLLVAAAWVKR